MLCRVSIFIEKDLQFKHTVKNKLSTFGTRGSTSPGAYLLIGNNVGHLIKELLSYRFTR